MKKMLSKLGLVLVGVFAAVAAFAAPDPFDYTTSITAFETDIVDLLQTNGPLLFGVLVIMLGFGLVWRLIKRAAKSV